MLTKTAPKTQERMLHENGELRSRLHDAEVMLNAIRNGEVDAIVVSGTDGEQIYSLISAETLYRVIFEEMNEGAVTVSSDGTILYCNRRFAGLVNEPTEQVIGSSFRRFIAQNEMQKFDELFSQGLICRSDGEIVSSFGNSFEELYLKLSLSPLHPGSTGDVCIMILDISDLKIKEKELTESQHVLEQRVADKVVELNHTIEELHSSRIATMNMMKDAVEANKALEITNKKLVDKISEHEQAKEALLNSEERYRLTLDNMMEGCQIVGFDWRYLYINDAVTKHGHATRQEMMGCTMMEVYPGIEKTEMFAVLQRCMDERTGAYLVNKFDYPDGTFAWFELSIQAVPEGIFILSFDISERRQAEELLQESEKKYHSLFTEMTEGFAVHEIICNDEGVPVDYRYVMINQSFEKLTGLKAENTVGRTVQEVLPGIDPFWIEIYGKVALTGEPVVFENYLKELDRYYRVSAFSQHKGQFAVLFEDITDRKRIEDELKKSEQMLSYSLKSSGAGLWDWDMISGKLEWSAELFVLFGLDPDNAQVTPDTWNKAIHPDDREDAAIRLQEAIKNKTHLRSEYRIVYPDGQIRWINALGNSTYDRDGKPLRMAGICFEITERKQAEEKIREKDIQFRKLSSNLPDLIFQFTKKPDGTYCVPVASEGIKNIFGCSPEDVIDDFEPISRVIYPGDAERVINDIEYSAEHLTYFTCEFRVQIPGKEIQWIYSKSTPEKLPDGSVTWYGFNANITERRKADEALKESEFKFRNTVLFLDEGFYSVTPEGILLDHNRAFACILGFSDDQNLKGVWLPDFWQNPEERKAYLDELILKNSISNYPIHVKTQKGEKISVLASAHLIKDSENNPLRIEGIFLDITDRMKAEEEIKNLNAGLEQRVYERTLQLETTNKELESFSYSVSHDLRAPLRSIDGFSNLLLKNYSAILDEQGKDYFQRVMNASRKMGILIDELLKLSRYTRVEMNCENVNLSSHAEAIAGELTTSSPERKVIFNIQPGMITKADNNLIPVVLYNLFSNAWKYSMYKPETKIEFASMEKEGNTVYFIRDNGAGFDMKYVDKLFGAFQRLHLNSEFEGTGIGLATVKRIIHRHGGTVWAEGEVNKGATFYFTL